ncbi:MAG: MerC family mercury resistance protein [Thermodesulfobacteriota bacterium]
MIIVELIYDTDCPNVKEARAQLFRAFAEAELPPRWQELDRGVPESPAYVRAYGSPTILVNGQDVANASPSAGDNCCRIYLDKNGRFRGVPSVEAITSALLKTEAVSSDTGAATIHRSNWRNTLTVIPGIGIALLPKLTCPVCWPAYAGLLSSLGLGLVNYTPYLLPLTVLFLILAVASLGYRAKNRRGYKPFILGVIAASIVIFSKFVFVSDLAMYGGIALLMSASLWNSWPERKTDSGFCPACVPAEPLTQEGNINKTKEVILDGSQRR